MRDDEFEGFVRSHSGALYRTAFLLTGNAGDAEELVQETLCHLYPRWDAVTAADVPLAYVRRALSNRFVSQRRSPRSRTTTPHWDLPDRWDGRDLGERVAVSSTIWQLLADLPDRQRAAVVLRFFCDLPDAEIALALGCREATVRSLVSRASASLRDAYTATTEGSLR